MFRRLSLAPREACPITWDRASDHLGIVNGKFTTPLGKQTYTFLFLDLGAVSFDFHNATQNDSQGITNTGESTTVFVTLGAAVKQYLAWYHPPGLLFTAKEPSRVKLYQMLGTRLAQLTGGHLSSEPSSNAHGPMTLFTLEL